MDQVFTRLEEARQIHDDRLVLLAVDPQFDSLRSDPRFAELQRLVDAGSRWFR